MDTETPNECRFGETLRTARDAAGMDLRQISDLTRVQFHYIEALEAEDWGSVPKGIIGRGFVRLIAREIHADVDDLLEKYHICRGEDPTAHLVHKDLGDEFQVSFGSNKIHLMGFVIDKAIFSIVGWLIGLLVALGLVLWIWSPWSASSLGEAPVVSPTSIEKHLLELTAVKTTRILVALDGKDPLSIEMAPKDTREFDTARAVITLPEVGAIRIGWDGTSLKEPLSSPEGGAVVNLPDDLEALKP